MTRLVICVVELEVAPLGLGAVSLDSGGSAWFLLATWRDDGV